MSAPLGGISMSDRCLSALASLGGEAATEDVRARIEADWQRRLTTAQVAVALARLSRLDPPQVIKHQATEGGWVWRTAEAEGWPDPPKPWEAEGFRPFTGADVEAIEAVAAAALREAPCLPRGRPSP
jgi:hypothetical protein